MSKENVSRRGFIKGSSAMAVSGAAMLSSGLLAGMSAKSYARIIGANERINCAAVGVNGRGNALIRAAMAQANTHVISLCDVDSRAIEKAKSEHLTPHNIETQDYVDYRELLTNKDIDAVLIATPEHWHAPMALMGLQAGKHVYLEKPTSHNPAEGEMLVAAQKKYKSLIQVGTQQRSAPTSIQAIREIQEGIIGNVYYGKAFYSNARKSIGFAKEAPVPEWLNWDLWQGPAPRESYKDITVLMKLTYVVGQWALLFLNQFLLQVDVFTLMMIGNFTIHKMLIMNTLRVR